MNKDRSTRPDDKAKELSIKTKPQDLTFKAKVKYLTVGGGSCSGYHQHHIKSNESAVVGQGREQGLGYTANSKDLVFDAKAEDLISRPNQSQRPEPRRRESRQFWLINAKCHIKSNEWALVGHPAVKNVKYGSRSQECSSLETGLVFRSKLSS